MLFQDLWKRESLEYTFFGRDQVTPGEVGNGAGKLEDAMVGTG